MRRLAVEDPGDPDAREAAKRVGLEVVGIPVTEGGIDVEPLAASGAEAVLVTPAHQFPTGAVLSPERRAALLDWARERDGLIIEDDYDAEHRYDHAPVGALHGLAPDRVVYAGHDQQDPRARPAPRLDDRARRARRAARRPQARRSTAARR